MLNQASVFGLNQRHVPTRRHFLHALPDIVGKVQTSIMPRSPLHTKTLPESFLAKKQKILKALAIPLSSYTDRSPKGSVDDEIKDLVDRINQLEGIVTTSSCAGRISVFLQGTNKSLQAGGDDEEGEGVQDEADKGGENDDDGGVVRLRQQVPTSAPGGKGRGGRWLFVSHEPVKVPSKQGLGETPLFRLFGLSHVSLATKELNISQVRFVRFQFEPMVSRMDQEPAVIQPSSLCPRQILHIMAASLQHARELLSAAINAGFRESGVQSLKNLDDPNSFPMVAVRTSGLALSSLIGCMQDSENEEEIQGLVNEAYLEILLSIANERFAQNSERVQRFSDNLFQKESEIGSAWEDKRVRQERKRAEGLGQQQRLREEKKEQNDLRQNDDCMRLGEDE